MDITRLFHPTDGKTVLNCNILRKKGVECCVLVLYLSSVGRNSTDFAWWNQNLVGRTIFYRRATSDLKWNTENDRFFFLDFARSCRMTESAPVEYPLFLSGMQVR